MSLSLNVCLSYCILLVSFWDRIGVGIQWNNISERISPDEEFTVEIAIYMMIANTIIYLLIAYYINSVFPGDYGLSRKWYFPFETIFGLKESENKNDFENYVPNNCESKFFESEPINLKCGVSMDNMWKTYDNKRFAVKDLSLNAYYGQITALLGHNGAGIQL